ncbi:hypothetical protein Lal_00008090, partial [Lupinus albus]
MKHVLLSKNKYKFIGCSIPTPNSIDQDFDVWERHNTILQSIKQWDKNISSYFTNLKIVWKELEALRPLPSCTCTIRCKCNVMKTIKNYRDSEYVMCFLKRLNDDFSTTNAQILSMEPLPAINKTNGDVSTKILFNSNDSRTQQSKNTSQQWIGGMGRVTCMEGTTNIKVEVEVLEGALDQEDPITLRCALSVGRRDTLLIYVITSIISFDKSQCMIHDMNTLKMIRHAKVQNNLYILSSHSRPLPQVTCFVNSVSNVLVFYLWYFRLGHLSISVLQSICKYFAYVHFDSHKTCILCHIAKQTKLHFPTKMHKCSP